MDFCSFPPEFAPQELPLKSLSCVSRTGGVDSTHCWEEVSQESRAFLAGTLFRKLVVGSPALLSWSLVSNDWSRMDSWRELGDHLCLFSCCGADVTPERSEKGSVKFLHFGSSSNCVNGFVPSLSVKVKCLSCVFIDWFGYYWCQQSQQTVSVSKETCWKIKITGCQGKRVTVLSRS